MSYPSGLAIHDLGCSQDYSSIELPKSEDVMSRMASIGIRCTWSQDELEQFGDQLVSSIKKVI
jgi:8-amino-3,8-dideoxy-alpha-D-manno-octulosonate transaminase